jgi:hypothetical protein
LDFRGGGGGFGFRFRNAQVQPFEDLHPSRFLFHGRGFGCLAEGLGQIRAALFRQSVEGAAEFEERTFGAEEPTGVGAQAEKFLGREVRVRQH